MSTLVHFKCNYDPTWDYKLIASRFFSGRKCIVQAEKLSTNAHVHFQGYTDMSDRRYEEEITKLSTSHFEFKVYQERVAAWKEGDEKPKRPRPVKRVKRTVDEKGFQYLCKEGTEPLYYCGFSPEELRQMKTASDEHVDEMKSGLKERLHKRTYPQNPPSEARKRMRLDALADYAANDKRPRPTFQKDILWIMYTHPQSDDAWKEFVADSI